VTECVRHPSVGRPTALFALDEQRPARRRLRGLVLLTSVAALAITGSASGGTGHERQVGTAGVDLMKGTPGDDVLIGLADRDAILGAAGDDVLRGGPGIDRIKGGDGDDTILGGLDNDVLDGDRGNDGLYGGAGDDLLRAADGRVDAVRCGPGEDVAIVDARDRVFDCEAIRR